ncbi:hypothetical protein KBD87_02355 [Candidatus Saccharibacteria bacterium]|nr:hypothetical protein [Candidatus Saccharibacteria bacterium]
MSLIWKIVLVLIIRVRALVYLRAHSDVRRTWYSKRVTRRYHKTGGNLVALVVLVGPLMYLLHLVILWIGAHIWQLAMIFVVLIIAKRLVPNVWRRGLSEVRCENAEHIGTVANLSPLSDT